MPELTIADVGDLVKHLNKLYQPKGGCSALADKTGMQLLVMRLRNYTDQVQEEAEEAGLSDETNVAQWAIDMANWRQRLAGYHTAIDEAVEDPGIASCEELYPTVVGPLLDGVFAGAKSTAGIADPSTPTVNDVATPYMLGNQVVVYREFQRQRFQALIDYFVDEAKALAKKVARAARKAAPNILMIGFGVGLAALGISWAIKETSKGVTRK